MAAALQAMPTLKTGGSQPLPGLRVTQLHALIKHLQDDVQVPTQPHLYHTSQKAILDISYYNINFFSQGK